MHCAHGFPIYEHFFSTGCAKFTLCFVNEKKYFRSSALPKNNY